MQLAMLFELSMESLMDWKAQWPYSYTPLCYVVHWLFQEQVCFWVSNLDDMIKPVGCSSEVHCGFAVSSRLVSCFTWHLDIISIVNYPRMLISLAWTVDLGQCSTWWYLPFLNWLNGFKPSKVRHYLYMCDAQDRNISNVYATSDAHLT